jgi:hypothetical protein
MKNLVILVVLFISSAHAYQEVYVEGLTCDSTGKIEITMRSLKKDFHLYLATNSEGNPEYFQSYSNCKKFSERLKEKFLFLTFESECKEKNWVTQEPVEIGRTCPNDRCSTRTELRNFSHKQTDCLLNGYRFFDIVKIRAAAR